MARERAVRQADDGKVSFFKILRGLLRITFGVFLMVFLSWIVAVVIELVGLAFFWPEEGAARSARVLEAELGYLGRDAIAISARADVIETTNQLYEYFFVKTHLAPLIEGAGETMHAVRNVTMILLLRLAILKTIVILYVLGTVWAFNEGLLFRAKRRWSGAVERSSLFHHSKLFLTVTVILPIPIYLALNFAVHPLMVTGPFLAVWMALVVSTVGLYKKFL